MSHELNELNREAPEHCINPELHLATGHTSECFRPNAGLYGSPIFYALLEEMARTHSKKSHDYANNTNPYGNYHFAGEVAAMFSHSPKDAGFAGRLAEKIYRLSILEGEGKTPLNESVEDTEVDIATIVVLWMADRRSRRGNG